jgi:hypothetical protein
MKRKETTMPDVVLTQSCYWDSLPPDVKRAFIGQGEKVFLPKNFALYKLTEFDIADRDGSITAWWSPVNPFRMDPGLESRKGVASRLNVPFSDLVRVTYAVREDWNASTYLLTAVLLKGVYGFYGQCSLQPRLTLGKAPRPNVLRGNTANLPGYGWQFYIPNLMAAHIRRLARTAV